MINISDYKVDLRTVMIFLTVVLGNDLVFDNYTLYRVAPKKPRNSRYGQFSGLCSDQQLSFFTLLDKTLFPHYNNTKIIKFGWELFILWVISYGLSFSGFARIARFPELRGTINAN